MISLDLIKRASERIAPHIIRTPLAESAALSDLSGTQVYMKLEHHQLTGSFKLRGATNAVLQLSRHERERGVIAASTGNHGRALAYAARAVGSHATICMSHLVPENKVSE
ncbi:pyridoxal-phosphate dependent enzyme, partial [Mesorhizobium sp. M0643]|uniref:pyridoxal-phosphate dependent enzyme n=1 Tax=Mesorhizobium sp. M0643 TaxID=2956978 RepID=UPI0033366C92